MIKFHVFYHAPGIGFDGKPYPWLRHRVDIFAETKDEAKRIAEERGIEASEIRKAPTRK